MTIDVGTGDGRAMVRAASAEPTTLCIGLDANAAAMAEASRRSARAARRGGLPNALFVLAAAEAPPTELLGLADLVTVAFPWGSLLRGCLGADPAVASGVAGLVARRGRLELLLAPADRDGLSSLPTDAESVIAAAATTFAELGFRLEEGRRASAAEIAASGSSWAKRLLHGGAKGTRAVALVRLRESRR